MSWGMSVNGSLGRGRAGRVFLAGTITLFIQAAAPFGWSRVTTNDDSLIRINGSTAPSTGGTNGFTATFNTQTQTGSQSITTATTATGTTGSTSLDGGVATTVATQVTGSTTITAALFASHTHTYTTIGCFTGFVCVCSGATSTATNTGATGSGGSHNHSIPALNLTGTSHSHSIPSLTVNSFTVGPLTLSTSIKYTDVMRAVQK